MSKYYINKRKKKVMISKASLFLTRTRNLIAITGAKRNTWIINILSDQNEIFWFDFAVGAMGGFIFNHCNV